MPFGLSNAPANFKSYINAEKVNIFVIIYINDIFIYRKDLGQASVNTV